MSRKPCSECPFSRTVKPGGTGGSDPGVYIGQACGPFFLPCHMDPAYYKDRRSLKLLQCAGAATFRTNVGVADLMPEGLLILPKDTDKVFATPAELLAHHLKCPLSMAQTMLTIITPTKLVKEQLSKVEAQFLDPKKVKQEQEAHAT